MRVVLGMWQGLLITRGACWSHNSGPGWSQESYLHMCARGGMGRWRGWVVADRTLFFVFAFLSVGLSVRAQL